MKKTLLITLALYGPIQIINAQDIKKDTLDKVFKLGEIAVTGEKARELNNSLTVNKMETFNRLDVSRALNMLPGVTLANMGARNESMVNVRGFDLRQVPVYIDGIPVYVPYDGYVDLARFTTFDLSEINVAKGFSSVLYGANALGGAINLVSRRPVNKLEINGATGWLTGGYRTNLNIGSRIGKFYVQGGVSRLKRDYYPLSENFQPAKTEDGDRRENSYNDDYKFNIKLAYTPGKKSEYAISYINQHGSKGTPVYAGNDIKNSQYTNPRYWQWPYWNKQSLYFISNTQLDSNNYLKTRIYYDQFQNQLNSYDNATYTTQLKPYAFQSFYDDYTYGGSLEYGTKLIPKNDLKFAAHYKHDVHHENNLGEPVRTMTDNTLSFGVENLYKASSKLSISGGLSFNIRNSGQAQNYNSKTKTISDFSVNNNSALNAQIGAFYDFTINRRVYATIARKSRFATIKDRYSYSLGTAIPNPDLKAEEAMNYEIGYNDLLFNKLKLQASVFYSSINNVIQSVNNVQYDSTASKWLSQQQNTGKAEFFGAELGVEYPVFKRLKAGFNYTYIVRNNLSNMAIKFTNVPDHKLFTYIQYKPIDRVYLLGSAEYNSARYSTSYGTQTSDFAIINLKASGKIWKYFAVEGGINNVFDKNYSLIEGYPEPGRNYFVNFVYNY